MTEVVILKYKHIDERVIPGKPLGRHVLHDSRSLQYKVGWADPSTFVSKRWDRSLPSLDQGNLGSCTGNATVGALATEPLYSALASKIAFGELTLNEEMAVLLYSLATQNDPFSGSYPPQDTGSNGLSVAQAAKDKGFISGYTHATSLNEMIAALQQTPVIVGVNWYEGFDKPDSNGLVHVTGQVRGGHEFEVLGVSMENKTFEAINSWGPGWGVNGRFYFSFDDMTRLLSEDGDCTQLLPLTVPVPEPQPVPEPVSPTPGPTPAPGGPDAADEALWAFGKGWSGQYHWYKDNKTMAQHLKDWAQAKGL